MIGWQHCGLSTHWLKENYSKVPYCRTERFANPFYLFWISALFCDVTNTKQWRSDENNEKNQRTLTKVLVRVWAILHQFNWTKYSAKPYWIIFYRQKGKISQVSFIKTSESKGRISVNIEFIMNVTKRISKNQTNLDDSYIIWTQIVQQIWI